MWTRRRTRKSMKMKFWLRSWNGRQRLRKTTRRSWLSTGSSWRSGSSGEGNRYRWNYDDHLFFTSFWALTGWFYYSESSLYALSTLANSIKSYMMNTHPLWLVSEAQKEEEKEEEEGPGAGRHRGGGWGPGDERSRGTRRGRPCQAAASREARLWLHRAAGEREGGQDPPETGGGHPDPGAVCCRQHHRQRTMPQVRQAVLHRGKEILVKRQIIHIKNYLKSI